MAAKNAPTPDFLGLAPYALLIADALADSADALEKDAIESNQSRVLAPIVQMRRRASVQVRAYAAEDGDVA